MIGAGIAILAIAVFTYYLNKYVERHHTAFYG